MRIYSEYYGFFIMVTSSKSANKNPGAEKGRGVACDFCRVSLLTSVPVSLVTSQSLPLQNAAMSRLLDLWLPRRPSLDLLPLLLPLPPPPLHPLSWCARCSGGSAHDAHEVDRFDAKTGVFFSDPSGRGFARNCLGARIYLGMFFVGVTEISFKHYSLEPKNMQACQPQTQPSQCFNPEMSKLFKSPQLQW